MDISTTEEASSLIEKNQSKLFIVLFFSSNKESEIMKDVCQKLQAENKEYRFIYILTNQGNELTKKYGVTKVPSCVLVRNGSPIKTVEGFAPGELTMELRSFDPLDDHNLSSDKDIFKNLINRSRVMIFIKGSPTSPRCGFTKKLIKLLDDRKIEYGYFDILTDNSVREGLKQYSNWPTYPQVYINGNFIGGLDIVEEMITTGEFQEYFK